MATIGGIFTYDDVDTIVNQIKALTDEEIDKIVEIAIENNLTQNPEGLKQDFLKIRSGEV